MAAKSAIFFLMTLLKNVQCKFGKLLEWRIFKFIIFAIGSGKSSFHICRDITRKKGHEPA